MRPIIVLFVFVVVLSVGDVSSTVHHKLIRLLLAKKILRSRVHIPLPLPLPIVSHRKKPQITVSELHKFHAHHSHHPAVPHPHPNPHQHYAVPEHHHDLPLFDASFPLAEPFDFDYGAKSNLKHIDFEGHDLKPEHIGHFSGHGNMKTSFGDVDRHQDASLFDHSNSQAAFGDNFFDAKHQHEHKHKLDALTDFGSPVNSANSRSSEYFDHSGPGSHNKLPDVNFKSELALEKHW